MRSEILVIREKDRFSSVLSEQGFSVTNFPTIKTEPLKDLSELENYLKEIENFDGIFITSLKATEIFLEKLNGKKFHGKIFVLGKSSNDLFKSAGLETFYSEQANTAEDLLKLIPEDELKGKRFLFPCGDRSLRVIPEKLKDFADVREAVVYKTIATENEKNKSELIKNKLERESFAAVCFFSPTGVESFLNKFPEFEQKKTKIAAIGQTTAKFAEEKNLRVDFISKKPTAEDYAFGLAEFLRKEI